MDKFELVISLKSYKENKASLRLKILEKKQCERRVKQYKRLESSKTAIIGINCDIHSKNIISNKTEKTALDTIALNEKEIHEAEERIKELTNEIEDLKEKIEETEIRLSALKYREKEILYAYYVEDRTCEDIGNNLYFRLFNQTRDKDTIRKIIENATLKMLNL